MLATRQQPGEKGAALAVWLSLKHFTDHLHPFPAFQLTSFFFSFSPVLPLCLSQMLLLSFSLFLAQTPVCKTQPTGKRADVPKLIPFNCSTLFRTKDPLSGIYLVCAPAVGQFGPPAWNLFSVPKEGGEGACGMRSEWKHVPVFMWSGRR